MDFVAEYTTFKATYRWSVKLLPVSSPLKLRNISYFDWRVEEEEDGEGDDSLLRSTKAVGNLDKRSTTN